jgi:hypothetical protein
MRVAPLGNAPVLQPFRGPVPLPASDVPGRADDVAAFPVITSARREAARITRLHGAGDVLRPLWCSLAPGIGVTRCPEHRHDQHREADDSDNHRQDDPRRGAKKLLLRCPDGWWWRHVADLLMPHGWTRPAPAPILCPGQGSAGRPRYPRKAQRPRELPAGLYAQTPGELHSHFCGLTAEDVTAILSDAPDVNQGDSPRVTWAWPRQDG